jgi:hypothetical protein
MQGATVKEGHVQTTVSKKAAEEAAERKRGDS